MLVRISRYFTYPDIKRQTPNEAFCWGRFIFTEDEVNPCDFLVILDQPNTPISTDVPPNRIIHISQEPPNEIAGYRQFGNKKVAHRFGQIKHSQITFSHGALPWHIDVNYDTLQKTKPEDLHKTNEVVWVTSSLNLSSGHYLRMKVVAQLQNSFVKIYGRGIQPIDDKYTVFKSAKYVIAFENYAHSGYWTEKIADAFLSYCLPIYFGATDIDAYFHPLSYVRLDPRSKTLLSDLQSIVDDHTWEKRLPYIIEARTDVLNKHQLFPFLVDKMEAILASEKQPNVPQRVEIPGGSAYFDNIPLSIRLQKIWVRMQYKWYAITKSRKL
ncbi:glycosyltransferase family 10 [Flavobacterium sp.]|uniref:glycosyltransferase family 10 domain-containing protein n=1 Tax=Flavobacterium sp. TaxID=239 RepID=UPI00261A937F|nr:glycosyltransferase family 10 [Flavobacterium sp.]